MFETFFSALGLGAAPNAPKHMPVIGISGGNADSASVRAMMTQISATGATPIFLGNHANRNAKDDINKIDALVVMGNDADIDPALYKQAKHEKTKLETATPEGRARADYEFELLKLAIEQKMPTLGVCGGMQRINVLLGGDLEQDLADRTGNRSHAQQEEHIAPFIPVQCVSIEGGTLLSDISRGVNKLFTPAHSNEPLTEIRENSMHHQAVKNVAQPMRACAVSHEQNAQGQPVDVVEAIEPDPRGPLANQFVLGVQWHPEFVASHLGGCIAERLRDEGSKYAVSQNRQHPMNEAVEENIKSAQMAASPAEKPSFGHFTAQLQSRHQQQQGFGHTAA